MNRSSVRIADLGQHVGTVVTVRAWVTHLRSKGKVAFVVARDGTGILQAVLVKTEVPEASWEAFGTLDPGVVDRADRRGARRCARAGRLRDGRPVAAP